MIRWEKMNMARKEISLDGDEWRIGQCMQGQGMDEVARWLPAVVPGNVRADLLRHGLIEDPFVGKQNELSLWVDDWNWWHRREIDAAPGPGRTFIRFDGIDYKSHIFFNGRKIKENEGMFAPVIVEISEMLAKRNSLAVNIEYAGQFTDREKTLKCQMGFGWDFAPVMRTCGLWDSVTLIRSGDVFIRQIDVEPIRVTDDYWEAQVRMTLDSRRETAVAAEFAVEGANFQSETKTLERKIQAPAGVSEHIISLPMKEPALWQPWEEGKPNLYKLSATLRGGRAGRAVLDNTSTRFGMRSATLLPNQNRPDERWTFAINDLRRYIRGANWVPCDSMPGRAGRERYEKLVKMARQANVNMLRVWGGGLREKKVFYDLCDEQGILVWQEIPLSCGRKPYSSDAGFRKLLRKEVSGILGSLHNHPSVVYYSGGNEINQTFNRRLITLMEKLVKEKGGGRPFRGGSPAVGESHNWRVFHGLANVADYRLEQASFLSEFGMQSAPVRESLDQFIPRENQWPVEPKFPYTLNEFPISGRMRAEEFDPINRMILSNSVKRRNAELWVYHDAQLMKIFRYAKQIGFYDCDSFIDATQRMQAHALQVAVEHMRRRRFEAGGVMFWQLNEPWPSVCWSVIDYYLRPKLAYDKLKEIYSPLLFSMEYPLGPYEADQTLRSRAFLINDRRTEYSGLDITISVAGKGGVEVDRVDRHVDRMPGDGIIEVEPVELALRGEGGWRIECAVSRAGKALSRNSYDLTIVDREATKKLFMAGDWIMHNIIWK
jgi:beta-mannosidase